MKKSVIIVALFVSASISAMADDIGNKVNGVAALSSNPNVATPMKAQAELQATLQFPNDVAPTSPEAINLFGHPVFFNGEVPLGGGWYYLRFPNGTPLGYYGYLSDPHIIYHIDLGYEYVIDANDAYRGIFIYDFASGAVCYTAQIFYPYFYDLSLDAVIYYLRGTRNPRWFYNVTDGYWFPS